MEYDKLQIIENKAEKLLKDVKYGADNASYTNAFYLLLVIYIISMSASYILTGDSILIYLVVLIVSLIVYKLIISTYAKKAQELSNYKSFDLNDKLPYVTRMLSYLGAEIELKIARVLALRYFYMIVFPFFMLLIAQIFLGIFDGNVLYINLAVALTLGVSYWFFYFKNDISELNLDKEDVDEMIKKISL